MTCKGIWFSILPFYFQLLHTIINCYDQMHGKYSVACHFQVLCDKHLDNCKSVTWFLHVHHLWLRKIYILIILVTKEYVYIAQFSS